MGKVGTNANGNFGLTIGSSKGFDVVNIQNRATLDSDGIEELKEPSEDELPTNTFRLYRHDYESAPLSLMESTFALNLPLNQKSILKKYDTIFDLRITGTGGWGQWNTCS